MKQLDVQVLPLFPSPVCAATIEEDLTEYFQQLRRVEFSSAQSNEGLYISSSVEVLNQFPNLKEILLNYFLAYKNDVLNYRNTSFDLTTSWVTKTRPGYCSDVHSHKNSCYSGVLYFDDLDYAGNLTFYSPIVDFSSFYLNPPEEVDFLNAVSWEIVPERNKVVFFPSYLKHGTQTNASKSTRYSLAFNFFPTGVIGCGDSKVNTQVSPIER
jgi:uncharacterized protein (TIGR02466 family)